MAFSQRNGEHSAERIRRRRFKEERVPKKDRKDGWKEGKEKKRRKRTGEKNLLAASFRCKRFICNLSCHIVQNETGDDREREKKKSISKQYYPYFFILSNPTPESPYSLPWSEIRGPTGAL